ncbi:hypothetical protein [Streptomyces sp. NPDC050704]|uniref:hypothetical protein n=1 Tax=Streptomyces sp. NPDC050704 TaxID=3157219 RepID=UPI00344AED12
MPQGDYGDLKVGRLLLRETFKTGESVGTARTLDLEGQESNPPLTRAELVWRHDNVTALESGCVTPLTFTDKPERNAYVTVDSVSAEYTEWRNDVVTSDWKLGLTRLGSDAEVDLQSRLTGVVRVNDFALSGERWHAPPIGHYGYQTGTTNPTTMTRTGLDGAITVYRGIPTGASPRWGCTPANYLNGRVRLTSGGTELCGVDQSLSPTGWALTNGLVNVTQSGTGRLDVQTYTGGAWRSKVWTVYSQTGTEVLAWDGATLLRNGPEHVILRLTKGLNPGRLTLDLALRRGSRIVEGYLQRSTSADLKVTLNTAEAYTNTSAQGYLVASSDDIDGNRFACGSARTFTADANGGVIKSSTTSLDFWLGVVASQATLNTNPTFETDGTGWTAFGGATYARSNTQAKFGSWSGLLTTGADASPRYEAATTAVTAGASYRASGWINPGSALPAGVGISVNWYTSADAYISTSSNNLVPTAGVWAQWDATVTAPPTAAKAGILLVAAGTPGAGILVYGDDIRLRGATPSGDAATDLRNQYIASLPETIYAVRR